MGAVADFNAVALEKTGAAETEPAIDINNALAKPTVIVRSINWISHDYLPFVHSLTHSFVTSD